MTKKTNQPTATLKVIQTTSKRICYGILSYTCVVWMRFIGVSACVLKLDINSHALSQHVETQMFRVFTCAHSSSSSREGNSTQEVWSDTQPKTNLKNKTIS
jgi:hypothetical protein